MESACIGHRSVRYAAAAAAETGPLARRTRPTSCRTRLILRWGQTAGNRSRAGTAVPGGSAPSGVSRRPASR